MGFIQESKFHLFIFSSKSISSAYKVGLSENEAISASKKVHFKATSKPDLVVSLLESYGFTKPYISKLITKRPSIFSSEPEIFLKPKFDFFISKGLSGIELAKFISSYSLVITRRFRTQIIPLFDFLKNIVHSDNSVLTILKRQPWILRNKPYEENMMANIELLRVEGVPQSNIIEFLSNTPRVFTLSTSKFKEIVEEVKGMGLDPHKTAFLSAIRRLAAMSKSTWEKKVNAFKKQGWSEDEITNAFKLHPQCMITSEKKITSIMDYLVNQKGYSSKLIARNPDVFYCSLEKRIIPRFSVYKIITSKGLVKHHQFSLGKLLKMAEESFLMKFVIKFEQEAPELLKLYPGAIKSKLLVVLLTDFQS